MKANLHTHTLYSDGKKSVSEMLTVMKNNGINIVAKTDHNSVKGIEEADAFCKANGMELIYGTEFTSYADDGVIDGIDSTFALHVLGYGFDIELMQKHLDKYEIRRKKMLSELVDRLVFDGYPISKEDGEASYTKDRVSIALLLVQAGCAETVSDAFDAVLNTKKYVAYTRFPFTVKDTIAAVHEAGGLAVWAHPYNLKRGGNKHYTDEQLEIVLKKFISYGLDGIEAYYLQFDERQINFLEKLAKKYNLLTSTGSDYHGRDIREDGLLLQDKAITSYTEKCMPLLEKLKRTARI